MLRTDSTAKECDYIQHEYRDLLSNWERGMSSALLEKQTALQRQHQKDELKRLDALKTADEIWSDYFNKRLEGKSSASTRRVGLAGRVFLPASFFGSAIAGQPQGLLI